MSWLCKSQGHMETKSILFLHIWSVRKSNNRKSILQTQFNSIRYRINHHILRCCNATFSFSRSLLCYLWRKNFLKHFCYNQQHTRVVQCTNFFLLAVSFLADNISLIFIIHILWEEVLAEATTVTLYLFFSTIFKNEMQWLIKKKRRNWINNKIQKCYTKMSRIESSRVHAIHKS